jgi:rhamnogalacturonan endolyase
VDADRHRIMPSGYDWDHGSPLNLKEARRMTTGVHKGEPEHKYDYSAVFSETPAYGWTSTKHEVGLWMINPSLEYIGGGPTKAGRRSSDRLYCIAIKPI